MMNFNLVLGSVQARSAKISSAYLHKDEAKIYTADECNLSYQLLISALFHC